MGKKYLIERTELPYDAMVRDPSWLIPVEEEEEGKENAEETEVQTVTVHVEGLPL